MEMKMRHLIAIALLLAAPMAFASTGAMSLIPRDAVSVGVVHVSDMRSSPLSGMLFQQTDKVSANGDAERFLSEAGLKPSKDVDLLVVSVTPKTALGNESKVLVAAEGRFSVDRLTAALTARGAKEKKTAGGSYYLLPDSKKDDDGPGAVAFPDAHLALIGDETSVSQALADRANGGTSFSTTAGLARELGRIDSSATAWALVDVARAARLTNAPKIENHNASAQQINAALNHVSTIALWATDTGDSLKLGAFGLSNDTETLQLLEDTLRGGLAAMRLAVQDKEPDLVTVLRRFDVKRASDSVTISGSVPAASLKKFANHSK